MKFYCDKFHIRRMFRFHDSNLMSPSNLSTVVAPSLVWQPPNSLDHTTAIINAQHANRTVQYFIAHAFTTQTCGQSERPSDRRMSIFGVSLQGHLEQQERRIPLIIESSIDELQKRGMRVKGIYRTCGVKSKIEEICEAFERCSRSSTVDISHVHPMNLACVVKLYLRKLPEPLMTHELYNEWIHFGMACFFLSSSYWFNGLTKFFQLHACFCFFCFFFLILKRISVQSLQSEQQASLLYGVVLSEQFSTEILVKYIDLC
ncbi:unnamed protein product [Angiostrongylus costaricensis]|uniref:Rho-GAP domain-containing protein n=1 Tax=Angiostrongylus costaricensis TaxID=334426 RepID=A0A0R3PH54_ANGCS|nr:unnamed protein product [Angiostrongylus costaricensis]